jgi:hypothetical protein
VFRLFSGTAILPNCLLRSTKIPFVPYNCTKGLCELFSHLKPKPNQQNLATLE